MTPYVIYMKSSEYWGGGKIGGVGGTQESFLQGDSSLMAEPLSFCIPFLTGKGILLYTFHREWYLFCGVCSRYVFIYHQSILTKT